MGESHRASWGKSTRAEGTALRVCWALQWGIHRRARRPAQRREEMDRSQLGLATVRTSEKQPTPNKDQKSEQASHRY